MNRKIPLGLSLALLLIVACLSVTLTMVFAMDRFSSTVNEVTKRQAQFDYLAEIDKAVRQNYRGTINESKLREAVASVYMQNIGDRYADYLTADEYAALQRARAGKGEGFGITLARGANGEVLVSAVDEASPAGLAGVQVGDVLTTIDGLTLDSVSGLTQAREELGAVSKAVLTVLREEKTVSFNLTRNEYELISVQSEMIDTVGYLRIRTFNATTPKQFFAAYEGLLSAGAQAVVFDVRGNQGGMLSAACEILSYLMPRGAYATRTNAGGGAETLSADNSAYELNIPAAVLVNGTTEGEAELFAGVLRSFSKALAIGTTTRGRAMVQEYFSVSSDNSAIKLTVAELGLIQGGSWETAGIVPDVEEKLNISVGSVDALTREQDTQLAAAVREMVAAVTGPSTTEPTTGTTVTVPTTTETEPTEESSAPDAENAES